MLGGGGKPYLRPSHIKSMTSTDLTRYATLGLVSKRIGSGMGILGAVGILISSDFFLYRKRHWERERRSRKRGFLKPLRVVRMKCTAAGRISYWQFNYPSLRCLNVSAQSFCDLNLNFGTPCAAGATMYRKVNFETHFIESLASHRDVCLEIASFRP